MGRRKQWFWKSNVSIMWYINYKNMWNFHARFSFVYISFKYNMIFKRKLLLLFFSLNSDLSLQGHIANGWIPLIKLPFSNPGPVHRISPLCIIVVANSSFPFQSVWDIFCDNANNIFQHAYTDLFLKNWNFPIFYELLQNISNILWTIIKRGSI